MTMMADRPGASADPPSPPTGGDIGIEIGITFTHIIRQVGLTSCIDISVRQADPKLMIVQRESPGKIVWQIRRLP